MEGRNDVLKSAEDAGINFINNIRNENRKIQTKIQKERTKKPQSKS